MLINDTKELEAVLAFFRKHIGRELGVTMSMFEGLTQLERMRVAEVGERGTLHYHVHLINPQSQRQIEIDLHHYSFATVSPDQKGVELGRLLGSNITLRLLASEIE
jgi:hypothetical protein